MKTYKTIHTQTTAENHAEDAKKQHVFQLFFVKALLRLGADAIFAQQPEQRERQHVHQAVPANSHGAEVDGDGVELRMSEHVIGYSFAIECWIIR